MERLTSKRVNGIKSGYWSAAKKDELIARLAEYEDTGKTPEEIRGFEETARKMVERTISLHRELKAEQSKHDSCWHCPNRVKNDYKRQEEYLAKVAEYKKKEKEQGFINEEERQKLQFDIDKAKKTAEEARKRLDKLDTGDTNSPMSEVRKSIGQKYSADKLKKEAERAEITIEDDKKKTFVTSGMSKLSRSERKIVSRILSIITEIAPKDVAEQIIEKIKEEMR